MNIYCLLIRIFFVYFHCIPPIRSKTTNHPTEYPVMRKFYFFGWRMESSLKLPQGFAPIKKNKHFFRTIMVFCLNKRE